MHAANDQPNRRNEPTSQESDDIDIELAADSAAVNSPNSAIMTAKLRSGLAIIAGFLAVFHLAFVLIKLTGPASLSDTPLRPLLVRAAVAGLTFAFLRSSLRLSRLQLGFVEAFLFGFEMLLTLIFQYTAGVELIDRRDLIDAVVIQKNGVIRILFLIVSSGIFLPRSPAATARITVTMAAALIFCHGVVLHHADTVDLNMDHVANHQIVMANALFLILGVSLATLAAWVLRGRDDDDDDQEGSDRVGPYRLIRKLDEGGSGEVYLAEHELLKRPCALKFVRSGDAAAVARFDREVLAAARLSHPNTIAIFDSGHTADGSPYCAMEYLPGLCVADIVQSSGPMPASRAVHIGRQVCGALAEAHRLRLVHRDLSPANVFLSVLGGRCDVAKVLDFGAVTERGAAANLDAITADNIAGTPEYIAPEQAVAGRAVDGRADIYGLGALLYFMVTGKPPFNRDTPADVLRAHVSEPVKPPREQTASVPADLEAVILRCLAKRPEDRYPDARAVGAALGACGCAADWDEASAEAWWVAQADGPTLKINT